MHEGLLFLWALSLSASLAAWFYRGICLFVYGRGRSRRGITGCEIARQILDRCGLGRVAVRLSPERGEGASPGLSFQVLSLPSRVYYGACHSDLAEALYEAMPILSGTRPHLGFFFRFDRTRPFRVVVWSSWFFIGAGMLLDALSGFLALGQFLGLAAFFLSLSTLVREWEAAPLVREALKVLEGVDMAERILMKRLLNVLRWSSLASLFSVLFSSDSWEDIASLFERGPKKPVLKSG